MITATRISQLHIVLYCFYFSAHLFNFFVLRNFLTLATLFTIHFLILVIMATIPVLHTLEHEVVVVGEAEEGEDDLPEEVQHGGHHAQQPGAQHHLLLELSTNLREVCKSSRLLTVFKPENTV